MHGPSDDDKKLFTLAAELGLLDLADEMGSFDEDCNPLNEIIPSEQSKKFKTFS